MRLLDDVRDRLGSLWKHADTGILTVLGQKLRDRGLDVFDRLQVGGADLVGVKVAGLEVHVGVELDLRLQLHLPLVVTSEAG